MKKFDIAEIKSAPDEFGNFYVTLQTYYEGEQFQMVLPDMYQAQTWAAVRVQKRGEFYDRMRAEHGL